MKGVQMRNIDTFRRMANLMFDSAQAIAERQTEFFRASVDHMNSTFEREEDKLNPNAILERQTEVCRDLFGAFTAHRSEIAEITAKCCAGMLHEAMGNITDLPMEASRTDQSGAAETSAKARPTKK